MATEEAVGNSVVSAPAVRDLPLKVSEPFLRARSRIIKLGWKPTRMHQDDDYEYSGIERELVDRKFLEIEGCSVDAGVLCIFYYSKQVNVFALIPSARMFRRLRLPDGQRNVRGIIRACKLE